jgi:hypothetical protein
MLRMDVSVGCGNRSNAGIVSSTLSQPILLKDNVLQICTMPHHETILVGVNNEEQGKFFHVSSTTSNKVLCGPTFAILVPCPVPRADLCATVEYELISEKTLY